METDTVTRAFAALAQETRFSMLRLLASAGASGLAAGEIATRLGVPPSTLSFHLAALDRAGLVAASRQGRSIRYAARLDTLRSLLGLLAETCSSDHPGTDRLSPAFNVLFLCTRNAARSIIAEAILNRLGAGRFRAYSAGSDPAPEPMPEVIAKLASLGHDVSRLASKSWEVFTGPAAPRMDFVIALCDTLENRTCPEFGDRPVTAAWPLPDPAAFRGSAAERERLLDDLYLSLQRRIDLFVSLPFDHADRLAAKAQLEAIGPRVAA